MKNLLISPLKALKNLYLGQHVNSVAWGKTLTVKAIAIEVDKADEPFLKVTYEEMYDDNHYVEFFQFNEPLEIVTPFNKPGEK